MRLPRRLAAVLVAALLLSSCGSGGSGGVDSVQDPKAMSLAAVLGQMALWTGTVSFTHWAALSHRAAPAGLGGFTPDWVAHADDFRRTTGVPATAMNWQIDQGDGEYLQILTQWTDGTALAKVVRALTDHGWRRAAQGHWTALTRPAPLATDGWEWAFRQDFLVDQKRGLLLSHVGNDAAREPHGDDNFADALGATLLAQAGDLVTGQLRVAAASCPVYGLLEANPKPPRSVFVQYATAVGGLGYLDGVVVGETSADGQQARAVVEARSAHQAAVELAPRASARARWDAVFGTHHAVTVTGQRQQGTTDEFMLRDGSAGDLPATVHDLALAVDSCGIN